MTVFELIAILKTHEQDADVAIDVDDGLDNNYMPVRGVRGIKTIMGEFVVIDADFGGAKK